MVTKLVTFHDLNKNSLYSTANEHLNVLFKKDKVLWGQWSNTNNHDNIENSTYKEMNNHGKGCIVYAYDKNSMLMKLKVQRVLKTQEVIDEHLEEYIPSYYGINQPVHYYLEISNIMTADISQASKIITDAGRKPLTEYKKFNLNNNRPWNVHEIENESNELLVPKHIFITKENCTAIISNETNNLNTSNNKSYVIYRIYHKNTLLYPKAQYIGETCNINRRMNEHFNPNNILNKNTENRHLYIAMYILGLENFTYEILEENIPTETIARKREGYWIDHFDSYVGKNGLNKRKEYQ